MISANEIDKFIGFSLYVVTENTMNKMLYTILNSEKKNTCKCLHTFWGTLEIGIYIFLMHCMLKSIELWTTQ